MRAPAFVLALVLAALGSTVIPGQPAASVVRGQVTDSSGGVLPGVTVVTTLDGRILTAGVTAGSGSVLLKALAPGRVTLTFQLEGFSSTAITVTLEEGGASRFVQRLELAQLAETVVAYACDQLRPGDFLASFKPEPVHGPEPAGAPAFSAAAKILFADAGQTLGAPRRLMVSVSCGSASASARR